MNIIHGFWQPDSGSAFIQSGQFYLWIETDTMHKARRSNTHSHQLTGSTLTEFCRMTLQLSSDQMRDVVQRSIMLPTSHQQPLPSPERALFLMQEEDESDVTLQPWTIDCMPLRRPIQALNQIHFFSSYHLDDTILGSDAQFWYQLSQSLKPILLKEHYVPAILRHEENDSVALYRHWQIVSEPYEQLIEQAKEQMPLACSQGYEPESLLRHFAEVSINEVLELAALKCPQTVRKPFDGTLLASFFSLNPYLGKASDFTVEFDQWYLWQQKVKIQPEHQRLQLGFRLEEAGDDPERWSLHFVAASRHDPSFKQELSSYWPLSAGEKQALEPMFGSHVPLQILKALGTAARIYPRLWQGMSTMEPQLVQLTLHEAFEFLKESAWILEDAGFRVIVPAWWTPKGRQRAKLRLRGGKRSRSDSAKSSKGLLSLDNLVDYHYELSIADQPLSPDEWQQLLEAKVPLIKFRGQWMELDRDKMQQMLDFWQQQGDEKPQMALPDLIRQLAEQESVFELDPNDTLAQMVTKLSDPSCMELIEPPQGLNATLRDYQRRGVSWLRYLEQLGLHGCLADDMGLGKTIQVIASMLVAKEQHTQSTSGPTLLIAPTSVLGNWQKEVARFAPQLTTFLHHGSDREQSAQELSAASLAHDMVITSYTMVRKDQKLLEQVAWERIVLDEAQNIKNPKAAQTRAIYKLKSRYRLALTGTPVENRLMDLLDYHRTSASLSSRSGMGGV